MHFYISFRYKKLKLKTNEDHKYKKILNENFLIYGRSQMLVLQYFMFYLRRTLKGKNA